MIEIEYLSEFGEVKFADLAEHSICLSDFESAFFKYFYKEKQSHASYKFAELNNPKIEDFEISFSNYFY